MDVVDAAFEDAFPVFVVDGEVGRLTERLHDSESGICVSDGSGQVVRLEGGPGRGANCSSTLARLSQDIQEARNWWM